MVNIIHKRDKNFILCAVIYFLCVNKIPEDKQYYFREL